MQKISEIVVGLSTLTLGVLIFLFILKGFYFIFQNDFFLVFATILFILFTVVMIIFSNIVGRWTINNFICSKCKNCYKKDLLFTEKKFCSKWDKEIYECKPYRVKCRE